MEEGKEPKGSYCDFFLRLQSFVQWLSGVFPRRAAVGASINL